MGTGERVDTCVLISIWLCRRTSQQAGVHTADPQCVLQSGAEGTSNFKTKTSSAMFCLWLGRQGVHPSASCPAAGGRAWGFSWGGERRREASWNKAAELLLAGRLELAGKPPSLRTVVSATEDWNLDVGFPHMHEELLGPKHPLKKPHKDPRLFLLSYPCRQCRARRSYKILNLTKWGGGETHKLSAGEK